MTEKTNVKIGDEIKEVHVQLVVMKMTNDENVVMA